MHSRSQVIRLTLTLLIATGACQERPTAPASGPPVVNADRDAPPGEDRRGNVRCDADNAGLVLPAGFCALVVADLVEDGQPAQARHIAVTPNGDLFVAINSPNNQNPSFGIIGLRDRDGDGHADQQSQFSPALGGSGIAWDNGTLFFGANDRVLRFRVPAGRLTPEGNPDVVVAGLPNSGDHISKTVVVKDHRQLFVNIGSASNSCQVANRQLESPGIFPCPELPIRAGVWLFDARATNQTEASGTHYASGYRNLVALAINPLNHDLYTVQQGRDMLFENWPQFYTQDQGANLPAEELARVTRGSDNGWPYCYFDAIAEHRKVLAPEYGGDGHRVRGAQGIDCSSYNQPLATFGAHWSPDGMMFYTGEQFPRRYRGGAFIAFHGGFNRAPEPNEGYQVQFIPFGRNGGPSGPAETFANGFAGSTGPLPATAKHRPVGVAVGPDGSLYVSDDKGGRIYRIVFIGGGRDD
ncbi:MAG TPA: PQQ-dependent sugar dehydrogenase [Gemmatimonadaceae bacterium]